MALNCNKLWVIQKVSKLSISIDGADLTSILNTLYTYLRHLLQDVYFLYQYYYILKCILLTTFNRLSTFMY